MFTTYTLKIYCSVTFGKYWKTEIKLHDYKQWKWLSFKLILEMILLSENLRELL